MIPVNQKDKINLTINSNDYSDYLTSFQVNYSSAEVLTGISYITGSLQLTKGLNPIELDYRVNPEFTPGSIIRLTVDDNPLPVAGYLVILNSNYDLKSTLTLDVGCLLASSNSKAGTDLSVCIDFGFKYPLGNTVATLLEASGIPELQISTADIVNLNRYYLVEPFSVAVGDNLVQSAAKLVAKYGYIIYQNNLGIVRVSNIVDTNRNYVLVSQQADLLTYSITSQPEQLIKLLNVSYGETEQLSILGTTATSASSNGIHVETITTTDTANRVISTLINEFRDGANGTRILVQQTNIVTEYEETSPVTRDGSLMSFTDCYPSSQARIVKKTIATTSDNTRILQAWLANKETANIPTGFTVSGTITANQEVTEYSYNENIVTIVNTVSQPVARVIPIIADLTLGTSNPNPIADINPTRLVTAYKTIKSYSRSLNSAKWNLTTIEYVNKNLAEPTSLVAITAVNGANLQSIIDGQQELVALSSTVELNQSLPEFELFSESQELYTKSHEILIGMEFNQGLVESIDLGNYYEPDSQLISDIMIAHFDMFNGRMFGCSASSPLVADVYWDLFVPFSLAKVVETTGVAYCYTIDSPGLTYSGTEVVMSFTGSLIGQASSNLNANFYAEQITKLPSMPVATTSQVYEFEPVNYTLEQTFTVE